ncbi:MAG: DNA-processing protein DprA [Parvularculaceae bacterium]
MSEGPAAALSAAERLDWLQLIRTETIGPVTFFRLLARFGSAAAALRALPSLARSAGRASMLKPFDRADAEAELDRARALGARLIGAGEPHYPKMLKPVCDRPPLIYVRGHDALFEKPAVAVIGARNASAAGRKMARNLAEGLGRAGVVVVSGLARGIDSAAHEASLASGTIAVVAGGADVVYPPENAGLMHDIAERGLVFSERAPGSEPTARDFPRRNRLISGLSRGVVVVEAAAKSGTLITARFALEQGREVFAVPGSPLDPRCQGANSLLRQGAILVETAEDILSVLAEQNRGAHEGKGPEDFGETGEPNGALLREVREAVREQLSFTPMHRDEILREVGALPGLVADALLELVLSGEAEEHSGGRFSLKAD